MVTTSPRTHPHMAHIQREQHEAAEPADRDRIPATASFIHRGTETDNINMMSMCVGICVACYTYVLFSACLPGNPNPLGEAHVGG